MGLLRYISKLCKTAKLKPYWRGPHTEKRQVQSFGHSTTSGTRRVLDSQTTR